MASARARASRPWEVRAGDVHEPTPLPMRDARSLLKWEGTLVDPIGALRGVLVFAGVSSGGAGGPAAC